MFAIWVVNEQFNAGFLNVLGEGVLAPLTGLEQCPPIKSFSWPEPLPVAAWAELLAEIAALPFPDSKAWWRFFVLNPSQGERLVLLQSRVVLDTELVCGLAALLGSAQSLGLPLGLQSDNPEAQALELHLKTALNSDANAETEPSVEMAHGLFDPLVISELEAVAELFSVSPLAVACMSLQQAFHRLLGTQAQPLQLVVGTQQACVELDSQQGNPLRWWLSQPASGAAIETFQASTVECPFLCCGQVLAFAVAGAHSVHADAEPLSLRMVQAGGGVCLSLTGQSAMSGLLNALVADLPDAFEQLLFAAFSMAGMGQLNNNRMLVLMDQGLPAMQGVMDALVARHYAPDMEDKALALNAQLEALNQQLNLQSSVDKNA